MKQFGKRLTKLLKERNLTKEDVAKKMKISTTPLNLWEKSKHTLMLEDIIKLAKVLNTSVDYLLGL